MAMHVSKVEEKNLDSWVSENQEQIHSALGVNWLISTDKNHIVLKEGLSVEDINELFK